MPAPTATVPATVGADGQAATDGAIRPLQVEISDEALDDLHRRLAASRWPHKELVDDRSQGVQLATMRELARYWATDHDWRKCEAKLNALPQFKTEIDGLGIHFIHVKSRHENALPLVITHGWPGSVVELLEVVGPLTDPTAHGGRAEDAFDVVLPSLPGYGFSEEPTSLGWDPGRVAQAWAELMTRLGYSRYVAQGGDIGAAVTDTMATQAPNGLAGIHLNFLRRPPLDVAAAALSGAPVPEGLTDKERAALDAFAMQFKKGYIAEQGQSPQTIGYSLTDSPVGSRGLDSRPRHRQLREDLTGLCRWADVGWPHSRQDPRQHHAVLADADSELGRADVLGERTRCGGRAYAARGLAAGVLHGVPRRDLSGAAPLGRERLSQPHLLQRSRSGRPLRGLGGAGALHRRAARGISVAPLDNRQ